MSYDLTIELRKSRSPSPANHIWNLAIGLTDEEAEIVKKSDITRAVTAALWRKQIDGAKEHDHTMRSGDDVNAIKNAFEEAIDLSQYLMKAIMEEED